MNTAFHYCYRDGNNFKQHGCVIFEGSIKNTKTLRSEIKKCLDMREFFIADQIDIPDKSDLLIEAYGLDSDNDHCWHEFIDVVESTDEPTDVRCRTINEFVRELKNVEWVEYDMAARHDKDGIEYKIACI